MLDIENKNGSIDENSIHKLIKKRYSKNINEHIKSTESFGDRLADKMADVAGSWGFILCFAAVLVVWITINSVWIIGKHFDPYPFILLNLVLSCISAIQAPIIMMSQNRQEEKDRLRAKNDYEINLKAEMIIEDLHIKIDTLLENQQKMINDYEIMKKKLDDVNKAD